MERNGFPGKWIRLIKFKIDGLQCCLEVSVASSNSFTKDCNEPIFGILYEDVGETGGLYCALFYKSNQFISFTV